MIGIGQGTQVHLSEVIGYHREKQNEHIMLATTVTVTVALVLGGSSNNSADGVDILDGDGSGITG